ncbi:MAG: division/cell wall cluster transcriptional repressor MraZ [Treponema sp.]|jgi:MraZ protein|nr:division/cell wall cluster transcriptional repressor MraZ [Treponema sp.]
MEVLLTGRFNVTLDEKGRISLPAPLRRILEDSRLTLTECDYDNCLWLFPTNVYMEQLKQYNMNTSLLSKKDRDFRRRIFDSHPVEIDKAGRIPIIQEYREFAGLDKNCIVLAQGDYIEIWDEERFRKCLADSREDFLSASEELGTKLKSNAGVNA